MPIVPLTPNANQEMNQETKQAPATNGAGKLTEQTAVEDRSIQDASEVKTAPPINQVNKNEAAPPIAPERITPTHPDAAAPARLLPANPGPSHLLPASPSGNSNTITPNLEPRAARPARLVPYDPSIGGPAAQIDTSIPPRAIRRLYPAPQQ